jgi:hypothetical protein
MTLTVLFCADPVNPRRTDEHFARESTAVRDTGGLTALIDHDALRQGDAAEAVRRVPRDLGPVWYRGWMVTGTQYVALANALKERGSSLVTRPGDYIRAHELPGWHDTFAGLTPASVWLPLSPGEVPPQHALAELTARLSGGPGVIKDYVKSRKHEWHEACFVPDLRDTDALRRVVARMVELQGPFLAGGLVIREYEPYGGGEVRIWWVDGEPVLTGPHPDTPETLPEPDVEVVRPVVRTLGCRFITTDLARHGIDGGWRVVEVGDGQVSELPPTIDPVELYEQLPGGFLS